MAAATVATGIAAAGAVSKIIGGAKQLRDAKRAARNFRRQELLNINRDRRISTRSEDLAREELIRNTGTSVDALRSGGIRGVVGGVGNLQESNINSARRIGASIDAKQERLNDQIAQDEARIRSIQENRDNQELAAIQTQRNAATQQLNSGIGDIAQIGSSLATGGIFGKGEQKGFDFSTVIDPNAAFEINPNNKALLGDFNF